MHRMERRFDTAVIFLVILLAAAACRTAAQEDGDEIVIGRYRRLYSEAMEEERLLLVSLPDGYEGGEARYPVVFLLHGNALERYAVYNAVLREEMEASRFPEAIFVGADQHGHGEVMPVETRYPESGRPERFLRFLTDDLVPFIDRNYRTVDFHVLCGAVDNGLFVVWAFLAKPDSFNAYAAACPDLAYCPELFTDLAEKRFAAGGVDGRFLQIIYWESERMSSTGPLDSFAELIKAKAPSSLFYDCKRVQPAGYGYFTQTTFREAMRGLFPDYEYSLADNEATLQALLDYYAALSKKYGFDIAPPALSMVRVGDAISSDPARAEEAAALFEEALRRFPSSLNAMHRLGELNLSLGRFDQAAGYYRRFLEIRPEQSLIQARLRVIESSAAVEIEKVLLSRGAEAARQLLRDIRSGLVTGKEISEAEFNACGYRLLGRGLVSEAVEVFKMNVELFPESANAFDSLGEGCLTSGDREAAKTAYAKSLELNPDNENAKRALAQLEGVK